MRQSIRRGLAVLTLAGTTALMGAETPKDKPFPTAAEILKDVKAPDGWQVKVFASPPEVGYPTALSASPSGELYVAIDENGSLDAKPNRGRIVRCIDTDHDGKADQFTTFAKMDSPRGVVVDGDTVYVQHPPFVTAYHDDNHDGVADRSEDLVKGLGFDLKFRGADHTTNGMRLGIDGFLYIASGDYGAVNAVAKDGSHFQLHGGGVVRVRTDGSQLEIVSRGQRNIYDVAVSPTLDLFTRDNTNDGGGWDVRLSHVTPTANYGYPSLFKNFPDEMVQPLADYGGGSPCGSLFVSEPGFPEGFGNTLYTCEWGRNAIMRHPLAPDGATYKAEQDPFIQLTRPTDMDVDGEGRFYIASWKGATFNYAGPNAGYVIVVTPQGHSPQAFPDLNTASDEQLLQHLASPSHVMRLATQRIMLRRGASPAIVKGLEKLAASDESVPVRVAAIFTLRQLQGEKSNEALVALVRAPEVREYAIKALADRPKDATRVSTELLSSALTDPNPRVRLAAETALGRLMRTEAAAQIVPLLADSDRIVAHVAEKTLITLDAAEPCLQAFQANNASLLPGLTHVLQSLHEENVVTALLAKLQTEKTPAVRTFIFKALCRLAYKEADWDLKWWGTRPDTSGPYFKTAEWAGTEKILPVLKEALKSESPELIKSLAVDMQKNKVDVPELQPLLLALAKRDPSFRATVVDLLTSRQSLSEDVQTFLADIASASSESISLRAKALRSLVRTGSNRSNDLIVSTLAAIEPSNADLARVWEDYVKEPRLAQSASYFTNLTASENPSRRELAYAVLLNIADNAKAPRGAHEAVTKSLAEATEKPDRAKSLLAAIARTHLKSQAQRVESLMKDARPEVAQAATATARQLGILKTAHPNSLIPKIGYGRTLAVVLKEKGNPQRGAELFVQQGCVNCHTTKPDDAPKGPMLAGIAQRYSRAELVESILKPSAKVAQGFESQWFKIKGDELDGFVTRESGTEVELRNVTGAVTVLQKKDIRSRGKREGSIMPNGLTDNLTPEDLASIIAYLESLNTK